MAQVVLEQLTKVFSGRQQASVTALDHVNLNLAAGELLAVVGPSGSGKTTLLRLIAGLETPSSGRIYLDGKPAEHLPPKARDTAMVFQNYALFPHLTVFENLALGLKLRRLPKPEIDQRVRAAAEWLGLLPCLARKPDALSGGERQRVALGRALVRRPRVFLLDEPFANLDPPLREQLLGELARWHRQLGATMIYVTHDQAEALRLGDRVAVIRAGQIEQVAPPQELYARPASIFVGGFMGEPPMNFFRGTLRARASEMVFEFASPTPWPLGPGQEQPLNAYRDQPVVLGLRPENFRLAQPGSTATWVIEAVVQSSQFRGADACVYLTIGEQNFIARVPNPVAGAPGEKVNLTVDLRQACFFDPQTERTICERRKD